MGLRVSVRVSMDEEGPVFGPQHHKGKKITENEEQKGEKVKEEERGGKRSPLLEEEREEGGC